MFAKAFESVKRRCFGAAAARPGTDGDASGADGDGTQRTDGDAGRLSGTPSTDEDTDPLRLTPNEEILRLVREGDGRIEQGDVVEALPWSPATVSRRLAELEAEGEVVRYPIGRRKVVCLPDSTPAAARSPFEA